MSDDSDSYTEVTTQSWFSRMGDSFIGALIGIVMFLVAFPLLFWNEGRAVATAKSLAEGRAAVISADAGQPQPNNDGKLVYVRGPLAVGEQLLPPQSGLGALKLSRKVEMYQWDEEKSSKTEKEIGGSSKTTTTYEYKKVWYDGVHNSSKFNRADTHQNPSAKPVANKDVAAKNPTLGGFRLSPAVVDLLDDLRPVPNELLPALLQRDLHQPLRQMGEWAYSGDPNQPKIGDIRVTYQYAPLGEASVIAKQAQGMLDGYTTSNGRTLLMGHMGAATIDQMFKEEEQGNTFLTWVLRAVGFGVMLVGLLMASRPLSVLSSILPFLESVLEVGAFIIAFPIALSLSLVTIAIAWITYRPLIGIPLLVVALAALFWPTIRKRMGGAPVAAPAGARRGPPPMPPGMPPRA